MDLRVEFVVAVERDGEVPGRLSWRGVAQAEYESKNRSEAKNLDQLKFQCQGHFLKHSAIVIYGFRVGEPD